jgi:LPXTG-motif cell wall-anchored protein
MKMGHARFNGGQEVLMTGKTVRFICAGIVLLTVTAGTALAQPADKRTYFTFSGPVAIPGVTLPAGKYLFRLADTSSRNVVQILSADGKTLYAMFFIYRAQRPEPASSPEVRFMETAAGMPSAAHTWWYPGDRTGYEFVYPKEQARLLAKGTGQPVLATVAEVPPAAVTPAPELARISPAGQEVPVSVEAAPIPMTPTGRAQVGELAPPSIVIAPPTQQARASLPKTASAMPLVALAGLILILGAALIRSWRLVRA